MSGVCVSIGASECLCGANSSPIFATSISGYSTSKDAKFSWKFNKQCYYLSVHLVECNTSVSIFEGR